MAYHKSMDKYINGQVRFWNHQKEAIDSLESKPGKGRSFVTVSREYGCGAFEISEKLVEVINENYNPEPIWAAYDRNLLNKLGEDMGLSESLMDTLTNNAHKKLTEFFQTSFSKFPPQVAVYRKLAETVRTLAFNGHVVIVGRAGNMMTRDLANGFHVRIVAPVSWKAERISKICGFSTKEAERIIAEKTKERDSYVKEFVKFDNNDTHNYHMIINAGRMTADEAAKSIADAMNNLKLL